MTIQPFKNAIAQNVFLFVVFTVFLFSCKKEPEPLTLPPATQTGENTFGCKVNGEVFVPNGNNLYPGISEPIINTEEDVFGFQCYNVKDYDCLTHVRVLVENCFGVGTYPCTYYPTTYFVGCMAGYDAGFRLDTNYDNIVQITRFDSENRIVAGTFEYNLIDIEANEKISVTEGRFDVGDVLVY